MLDLGNIASKLDVSFHARFEEILHVICHRASRLTVNGNGSHLMPTTEVHAYGSGFFNFQSLFQEIPALKKVPFGAREFEIVDVNDQVQAECWVEVARRPLLRHGFKPDGFNMLVAMTLPEGTTVRVSVQGLAKLYDRLVKFRPRSWSGFRWQTNPARGSRELSLDISLLRVSDLDIVIRG